MHRLTPVVLAPFIIIAIIAAACSAAKGPSTTQTPSATATVTRSPVALTRTATPTAVPTPRTMALDPKTRPYLAAAASQTQTIDDSVRQFFTLVTSPQLSDPAWRKQVVLSVVPWTSTYQNAQKLDPPACLSTSNQTYLGALQALNTAATDVTQSLAAQSQIELDATRLEVLQALEILQRAATQAKNAGC